MKKTAVLLVSTLMLGVSASAMADSNRWNHDHKDRYDNRYDRYDHRYDHREQPRWSNGDRGNHYGQRINFKRGERLPSGFRSNRYVVSNYRTHRLYEPPRGYNWMQVQGKYVLVDSKYRVFRVA
ncbi:RcnB family protein [Acinetobacter dispersus]|uniref:RcnB family protein n=1 Tax=Acinetobacter dispersus TaxID=70348 RepID=UPI003C2B5065